MLNWLKWLPWKWVVSRMARSQGFLDPIGILSKVRGFSQPSEVQEPIELLRAGVIMHARGLMNSRAIQHNLDWVWPWWVCRQFDPTDPAFVPRAFSLTHINLTHRNWTAVGLPDVPEYPIVDPGGGVTPIIDGWTLEGWIYTDDHALLVPQRASHLRQHMDCRGNLSIVTCAQENGRHVEHVVSMTLEQGVPQCRIVFKGHAPGNGWLVVSVRPYNPEGVSFIHRIELHFGDRPQWRIDDEHEVHFDVSPDRHAASHYGQGDVAMHLDAGSSHGIQCPVGMATASALFRLTPGKEREIGITVPLGTETSHVARPMRYTTPEEGWALSLENHCAICIPDERHQFLYESALRTLILHSPDDVYPGPYTYRRFWFRDAAYILNAMLFAGLHDRCERVLDRFPERQTPLGYFHSQQGEWDSNGQSLWILQRFCRVTGRLPKPLWVKAMERGASWIQRKRLSTDADSPYAGLLPAGFSAEHLGPNDYYYWDDFWSVAGLKAVADAMRTLQNPQAAETYDRDAEQFLAVIERSLHAAAGRLGRPAMPAAPLRRLDAGAIGSIVAGFPIQLFEADDPRLLDLVEWLMDRCFQRGGFFQDMIHSGINAYLTLQVAQVLLRAGDPRAVDLMHNVAELATPTGQWPEAIHPRTFGGCMGDGQHVWASAEWVMLLRNAFLFEEEKHRRLVIGGGIPAQWLKPGGPPLEIGPAPTLWGTVFLSFRPAEEAVEVVWNAHWRHPPAAIECRLADCRRSDVDPEAGRIRLEREVAL